MRVFVSGEFTSSNKETSLACTIYEKTLPIFTPICGVFLCKIYHFSLLRPPPLHLCDSTRYQKLCLHKASIWFACSLSSVMDCNTTYLFQLWNAHYGVHIERCMGGLKASCMDPWEDSLKANDQTKSASKRTWVVLRLLLWTLERNLSRLLTKQKLHPSLLWGCVDMKVFRCHYLSSTKKLV